MDGLQSGTKEDDNDMGYEWMMPQTTKPQSLTIAQFFEQCMSRQERINELSIEEMDGERRAVEVRNATLAAIVELIEAMDSVRWKPWHSMKMGLAKTMPRDRGHEVADIMLFVMNLASYLLYDVPREERAAFLEAAVIEKSQIVDDRLGNDSRDA